MGVFGLHALVGRRRDLNPGPPACESGVVAISLLVSFGNILAKLKMDTIK